MRKRKQDSRSSGKSSAGAGGPPAGVFEIHSLQSADPSPRSLGGQRIVGSLDAIVGNAVEGWAMNIETPTEPVTVEIFDGEHLLGSAVAFMFRPDLLAAGIGTGNHYFKFTLPEIVSDGHVHFIFARAAGSAENLSNSPISVSRNAEFNDSPAKTTVAGAAVGMLEVVSDEGWVKGWAWYPSAPDRRVEIEVLVDGEVVGDTVAAAPRQDLVSAGIGDGNHGFAIALPYEVLARPRASLVSLRDKATGRILAEPRLFQRREIANALEKLSELENDARLLTSTAAMAADRASADQRAAADLFRTVGDFFVQLANATAAGKPPGTLKTLRGAIDDVTVRFPPIEFNIPSDPQLSICVDATGTVETIYDTLRSICGFKSKITFEVVLFDSGACDEALLLPLVARNLRYFRADEGSNPVAVRNRTAEFARGEIIVFLSGIAGPSRNWPEMIFAAFQADESLAVVGAKILRADGVLENAGMALTSGRSEAIGPGADPSSEPFLHRRRIDAVTSAAFAVRRVAWQRGSGLDESRAGVESALADFCVRTSAADGKIVYEPDFEVVLRR